RTFVRCRCSGCPGGGRPMPIRRSTTTPPCSEAGVARGGKKRARRHSGDGGPSPAPATPARRVPHQTVVSAGLNPSIVATSTPPVNRSSTVSYWPTSVPKATPSSTTEPSGVAVLVLLAPEKVSFTEPVPSSLTVRFWTALSSTKKSRNDRLLSLFVVEPGSSESAVYVSRASSR